MEDKHRYFVIAMDVGKHRVLYRGCQRLNREYSPVTYIRTQRDSLREVRGLRQAPAHSIQEDEYDKQFYKLQDELVWRVYGALKSLREVLRSDVATAEYDPPSWESMTIKSY